MLRNTIFLIAGLATAVALPMATGLTTKDLSRLIDYRQEEPVKASFIQVGMEKKDIILTRIIDAPLEKVWKAWTGPEEVAKWWGAKGFTSPSAKIDFRIGGKYLFHMRASQELGGMDFYNTGEYTSIEERRMIAFTQSLADKDGNKLEPSQLGMPHDFPAEVQVKLLFKKKGKRTELTVIESGWTVGGMRAISEQGLQESIDKLAVSVQ